MVGVELKKQMKLNDLELGKIFDDAELIIERHGDNMTTIRNETGVECGKNYDIRIYRYDLKIEDKNIIFIDNNGYGEMYIDDKDYLKYKKMLKKHNLWFEN